MIVREDMQTLNLKKGFSFILCLVLLIGTDGSVLAESETEKVKINDSFFARLAAFFRRIFNRLPVMNQGFKENRIV